MKHLFLILVLILPCLPSIALSDGVPKSRFIGQILPLGEFGAFEILGDERIEASPPYQHYFRLWGVIVSSEDLAIFVGQETFDCSEIGLVNTFTVGPIRVVNCVSAANTSLSESLLDAELAAPICVEIARHPTCLPRN